MKNVAVEHRICILKSDGETMQRTIGTVHESKTKK